jgi:PhnB protein
MMSLRLTPYLSMDGNAKKAVEFYEQALGAQVMMIQTFGEMPENPEFPVPEEAKGRLAHAMLKVGESELMFSDTFPGQPLQNGSNVSICITLTDLNQAKQIFEALSQGGQVTMPLQETFFSPAYGTVTDKFGIAFQIFGERQN